MARRFRWVGADGKLAEVVFTDGEIERLRHGGSVGSYGSEHVVARWTAAEARAHIERRLGEIERRQRELLDGE